MSGVDVVALRAAAEAATPGPWGSTHDAQVVGADGSLFDGVQLADCFQVDPAGDSNATFIAAANPAVVLALLDRVSELEAVVERAETLAMGWAMWSDRFASPPEVARLHQCAEALRGLLASSRGAQGDDRGEVGSECADGANGAETAAAEDCSGHLGVCPSPKQLRQSAPARAWDEGRKATSHLNPYRLAVE